MSDVATLAPNSPHRFFTGGFRLQSFAIFDADTGKMEGNIPAGYVSNLAIAPDNSRVLRIRDLLDAWVARKAAGSRRRSTMPRTLNLLKEINLPGRALVEKMQNFDINASGSRAYVYVMMPVASVVWVDLKKQAVGGTVEIPGCALVFPWGDAGFSSLCGDGSLATVTIPDSGSGEGDPHQAVLRREQGSDLRRTASSIAPREGNFPLLHRPRATTRAWG